MTPIRTQALLQRLACLRLDPATPDGPPLEGLRQEMRLRRLELRFIEAERLQVMHLSQQVPRTVEGFVRWLRAAQRWGPGQRDPLFKWLEHHANWPQYRWFLHQEVAGEAGFDDLVALTQVKMPARAKLELARNYWDEMGRGQERAMHGPMLHRLGQAFGLAGYDAPIVWEAQAVGNVLGALAANRRYAYHALGALGAVELTAPGRALHVNRGLKRLGVHGSVRRYFAVHATLDVKHGEAWIEEVFVPIVQSDPELAVSLAEGLLMRLRAGARAFQRYRMVLWGNALQPPAPKASKRSLPHKRPRAVQQVSP